MITCLSGYGNWSEEMHRYPRCNLGPVSRAPIPNDDSRVQALLTFDYPNSPYWHPSKVARFRDYSRVLKGDEAWEYSSGVDTLAWYFGVPVEDLKDKLSAHGNQEYLSSLVKNMHMRFYKTPVLEQELMIAIEDRDFEKIDVLLNSEAFESLNFGICCTPLAKALVNKDFEMFEFLLERGADINYWEIILVYFTQMGENSLIQYLIDHRADPNAQNKHGKKALDYVVYGSQYYSFDLTEYRFLFEKTDYNPDEILQTFLYASVDARGWGGYQAVVRDRNRRHLNFLFELPKKPNPNAKVSYGDKQNVNGKYEGTAFNFAAQFGLVDILKQLIEKGVYINGTDSLGYTPLMAAAAAGQSEVIQLFLKSRVAITHVAENGKTAQQVAEENKHFNIAEALRLVEAWVHLGLENAIYHQDRGGIYKEMQKIETDRHAQKRAISFALLVGQYEIAHQLAEEWNVAEWILETEEGGYGLFDALTPSSWVDWWVGRAFDPDNNFMDLLTLLRNAKMEGEGSLDAFLQSTFPQVTNLSDLNQ